MSSRPPAPAPRPLPTAPVAPPPPAGPPDPGSSDLLHEARERRLGLFFACGTALLWGLLAIAMKVATDDGIAVIPIVWFRFAFSFLGVAAFVTWRSRGRLKILAKPPPLALVAAVLLTINYIGYLEGLERTTPTNAQILIQLAPLMLALIGIFLFKERMTRRQGLGVAVALVGFALFAWDKHQAASLGGADLTSGNLIIVGGAAAWALYAAAQKLLVMRGIAPQDLNVIFYAVPTVLLLPLVDWSAFVGISGGMWLVMLFLGANTLLGYGFLGEAFKRLPAWQVSLIITLNPLITLAVMRALEPLDPAWLPADHVGAVGYLAALLVVGGVGWVLYWARARRR